MPAKLSPSIFLLPHQRTAAVSLTRIFLPLLVPGAEEGVSDGLLVARGVEHVLAVTIVNHWHRHLVQNVGDTAT